MCGVCVIRYASKDIHLGDLCLKVIDLSARNLITIQGSLVKIIE